MHTPRSFRAVLLTAVPTLLALAPATGACCGVDEELISLFAGVSTSAIVTGSTGDHSPDMRVGVGGSLVFINAALEANQDGEATVLGGVGFGYLLQVQYGYGEGANVVRLRSEFPIVDKNWHLGNTPVYPRVVVVADKLRGNGHGAGSFRFGAGLALGF